MRAHRRTPRTCPPPCGAEFQARASDVQKGLGIYHTRACSARARWIRKKHGTTTPGGAG